MRFPNVPASNDCLLSAFTAGVPQGIGKTHRFKARRRSGGRRRRYRPFAFYARTLALAAAALGQSGGRSERRRAADLHANDANVRPASTRRKSANLQKLSNILRCGANYHSGHKRNKAAFRPTGTPAVGGGRDAPTFSCNFATLPFFPPSSGAVTPSWSDAGLPTFPTLRT